VREPANILTRATIRAQLALYQNGELSATELARWAFKQFADHEDELLDYESQHEVLIAEVLDDLMWTDAAPFALDAAAARAIAERLQ
jgi:hypothetical protein